MQVTEIIKSGSWLPPHDFHLFQVKVVRSGELDLDISRQNVVACIDGLDIAGAATMVDLLYLSAGIVQEADVEVAQPILAAFDSVVNRHMLDLLCSS